MCRARRVPVIANALNLSRAEVYGVVSFYHDYRQEPAGRHVLKLCRPRPASRWARRRDRRRGQAELLGIDFHETAKDGSVTLEPVYCLGLCACSPSAMLDGEVIGRLDEARSTRSSRRCGHEAGHLHPARFRRAWRWAPKRSPTPIAHEIQARDIDARIVRNGSRGLYWLEPMVEVETPKPGASPMAGRGDGREVAVRRRLPVGRQARAMALGDPEKIPFLAKQTRLTFARCGITDPLSLDDYARPWRA